MTEKRMDEKPLSKTIAEANEKASDLTRYQMPPNYGAIAYIAVPVDTLRATINALRSYQYGNTAPALAEACADLLEKAITRAPAPLEERT